MERPDPTAALHRALPVMLVPLVIGGGLVASRGDAAGRFWGWGVLLAVLAVGACLVAVGVRDLVRDCRAPVVGRGADASHRSGCRATPMEQWMPRTGVVCGRPGVPATEDPERTAPGRSPSGSR